VRGAHGQAAPLGRRARDRHVGPRRARQRQRGAVEGAVVARGAALAAIGAGGLGQVVAVAVVADGALVEAAVYGDIVGASLGHVGAERAVPVHRGGDDDGADAGVGAVKGAVIDHGGWEGPLDVEGGALPHEQGGMDGSLVNGR